MNEFMGNPVYADKIGFTLGTVIRTMVFGRKTAASKILCCQYFSNNINQSIGVTKFIRILSFFECFE